MNDLRWSLFGDQSWHGVTRPDFDHTQAEVLSSQIERFSALGVIRNAVETDDWTTEEPEILVDCE
jgi:hypothetical protein